MTYPMVASAVFGFAVGVNTVIAAYHGFEKRWIAMTFHLAMMLIMAMPFLSYVDRLNN